MIIVLKPDATEDQIQHIVERTEKLGLKVNLSRGVERTVIGLIGPEDVLRVTPLEAFAGVEKVIPVLAPYRLVSREFKKENSVVKINSKLDIGGTKIVVMAGPCSIEGFDKFRQVAQMVKKSGATVLRGGAFKPRTSPYDFQGLGEEGLKILSEVGKELGLMTVTEVIDAPDI